MSISVGDSFGRLVVIRQGKLSGRNRYWICACECGKEKEICYSSLSRGASKSCGCLNSELSSKRKTTHGLSKSAAYNVWINMKSRCLNPNNSSFDNYGGRGISICKRWLNFENFYADMGEPPAAHEIDRIDNNGDYAPSNCKWSTKHEQSENRRTNRIFYYKGEIKTLSQLSRASGISYFTLWARLVTLKWDIDRAMTIKPEQ